MRDGFVETLAYTEFPPEHWRQIRTNNGIERINCEIRRRTRVVRTFPDDNSALLLVAARLKHIVEHERGKRRYLDMSMLEKMDELKEKAEGQKRTGPRTAKSICERIFTVPSMKLVCELHRRAKRSNDRKIKARIALPLARFSQLKEHARGNRQVSQFLKNG